MKSSLPVVSVIIPTLNAARLLPAQLAALRGQRLPASVNPELDVVVIDSSSNDGTPALATAANCRVLSIDRSEFRHGKARNLAARAARGAYLVFLTQDALPADEHCLAELLRPLLSGQAQAATARQMAPASADPLERFARAFNYPAESVLRTVADAPRLGVKAFFFSNTASAVEAQRFWRLGGFSEDVIVNEDMHFCARLLRDGGSAAYVAEARVWHAHAYSLRSVFARYFDIGVFFRAQAALLQGARAGGEGLRFVRGQMTELARAGEWGWMIRAAAQAGVKALAFWCGRHYPWFPRAWARRWSGQKAYWNSVVE